MITCTLHGWKTVLLLLHIPLPPHLSVKCDSLLSVGLWHRSEGSYKKDEAETRYQSKQLVSLENCYSYIPPPLPLKYLPPSSTTHKSSGPLARWQVGNASMNEVVILIYSYRKLIANIIVNLREMSIKQLL